MAEPLQAAAEALSRGYMERDKVLVLVTDGQVSNEAQILKMLGVKLRNVRTLTVGIDQAVNASFLERLAAIGGGMCELVDSEERLEEVMERLHAKVSSPVLTKLAVEVEGMVEGSVVPKRLPALFDGVPLVVLGRYRGEAPRTGSVRGQVVGGADQMQMGLIADVTQNPALRTVWARAEVRALEDRFIVGERGLQGEIIAHSLRYGVLSSMTAFVAVDREIVNEGGQIHKVIQAVEDPHRRDQADTFREKEAAAMPQQPAPTMQAPPVVYQKRKARSSNGFDNSFQSFTRPAELRERRSADTTAAGAAFAPEEARALSPKDSSQATFGGAQGAPSPTYGGAPPSASRERQNTASSPRPAPRRAPVAPAQRASAPPSSKEDSAFNASLNSHLPTSTPAPTSPLPSTSPTPRHTRSALPIIIAMLLIFLLMTLLFWMLRG
jgi:hypothetical protein